MIKSITKSGAVTKFTSNEFQSRIEYGRKE